MYSAVRRRSAGFLRSGVARRKFPPVAWPLLLSAAATLAAQTVIARIARGDRVALRALYEECAGRALAIAERMLGSGAEAEEVVQETLLDLWRRAPEFEHERGAPGPLVATLARRRAIDRLRARSGTQPPPEPRKSESPALSAERWQERERVRTALKTLPDDQRLAIELAYFSGLTQAQIAQKLGEPLDATRTRIRAAMEKLSAMLPETR